MACEVPVAVVAVEMDGAEQTVVEREADPSRAVCAEREHGELNGERRKRARSCPTLFNPTTQRHWQSHL